MKSKQKLIHVIQLCGRKKGMLYITVVKIRGVKSRTPLVLRWDMDVLIVGGLLGHGCSYS